MNMTKTVFVIPATGLKVADQERGGHLPEGGAEVPQTSYWNRRIKDGDVTVAAKSTKKKEG